MLGIIISAGMASGLALVLASLTKEQQVVQRRTESYFEVNNLSYLILRTLEDAEACTRTLGRGTTIASSARWSAIKNKDGEIVLDKSKKYGNGLVKMQSIVPKNINISGTSGDILLQVTFKNVGPTAKNAKTSKSFPLSIDVDADGKLIKCRSNYTNIISTSKERMCRVLGGAFDLGAETCDLTTLLEEGQKEICGSMDGVFDENSSNCNMDSFVWKTVKEVCTSVQGTFDDSSKKCLLSSSVSPPSDEEEDDDEVKLKDSYRVCRLGYGVGEDNKGKYGRETFSTCFGPEVLKLFKKIKNQDDVVVRTLPWVSHWFQYDSDGALENINFYNRPLYKFKKGWWFPIYFVNADPLEKFLPGYELIVSQVKMKEPGSGKWYTFTFSMGIAYIHKDTLEKDKWRYQGPSNPVYYEYKWLDPWP